MDQARRDELRRKINDPAYIDGALDVVAEKLAHTFEREFAEEAIVKKPGVEDALEIIAQGGRVSYRKPEDLKRHPRNDFPDVTGKKWDDFVESIRHTGVLHPILIDREDRILSGVQRNRACSQLGIRVPAIQIQRPLNSDLSRHIIVVTNIGARGYTQAEFEKLWKEVYADWAAKLVRSGLSVNKAAVEISSSSGLKFSRVKRTIQKTVNAALAKKYKSIESMPLADAAKLRLKRAIAEADDLRERIERLVIQYQTCRKVVAELIPPGMVRLDEMTVQRREDKLSSRTGLPELSLNKSRSIKR